MIKQESNAIAVLEKMKAKLETLVDADKILRSAAFDSQAAITSRVQQRGLKSDGSPIGKYSKGYAKMRSEKGRQTSHVDLTFEGDLMRNFIAAPVSKNEYAVGFDSKKEADKAQWLEDYYGPIFNLSNEERKNAVSTIEKNVIALLR